MPDPTQADPEHIRVALDHGDVVELDGATLSVTGEESPSVLLRLTPARARTMARILAEWSSVAQIFHRQTRPYLDELDLSRTLELAAAVLDHNDEPVLRPTHRTRAVSQRQRLAAVAILGTRETHLSAVQRLALVDAAAWWLSDPSGGDQLAYALLAATCSAEITTEHVYLALITPPGQPDEHPDDPPR
ncbi:MAG TPA: hypothetical protein VHH34_07020 [Pseudonocardiaceae bacterium]|nr:hypothetical protein [Pseudonocardiaceae bacterium]